MVKCNQRIHFFLRFIFILIILYYMLQAVVFYSRNSHSRTVIPVDTKQIWYHDQSQQVNSTSACSDVHILIQASNPVEIRALSVMLQLLFFHRTRPLHLHHVGDSTTTRILDNLIDTWDLPLVYTHFYPLTSGVEVKNPFSLATKLPKTVDKVIFISNSVYIVKDVGILWDSFNSFSPKQILGVIPKQNSSSHSPEFHTDIILMNFRNQRNQENAEHPPTFTNLNEDQVYHISCAWGIRMEENFDAGKCLTGPYRTVQALINGPMMTKFTGGKMLEDTKEYVHLVGNVEDLSSFASVPCPSRSPVRPLPDKSIKCAEFRYATQMKRRTHLYYIGEPYFNDQDPFEVTLVTQLTIDRFNVLEKMLTHWEGPAIVVMHVKPADVQLLLVKVQKSRVTKSRKNLSFHLVYRRGPFYPINFLRNVGVNESHTPYTIFVDVDLVPTPKIYPQAKKYIEKYMHHNSSIALVVPSFEARTEIPNFPKNKQDMLQLLKENKTIGYRMWRGWNLGHKPTNYPKWINATEIYQAIWRDAFEPYTIVRTASMPRYNEDLFERMGDKIAFGRELHARRFLFYVLPDLFVLHLIHPVSEGTSLWMSSGSYSKCSSVLFEEFRARLKSQHPDVKF